MLSHVRRQPQSPGARVERGRAASASGETLIEVMATIVLLGVGIAAILGAILTLTITTRQNQDRTKSSLAMQFAAETMMSPSTPYVPCALPGTYSIQLPVNATGAPSGQTFDDYTATVFTVEYLNRSLGPFVPPTGFDGNGLPEMEPTPNYSTNCFLDPNADRFVSGLQKVTIEIKKGSTTVDTAVLYKRSRYCPETFNNADAGPC